MELIERLRDMAPYSEGYHAAQAAAAWIERWAPVVEAARRARQASAACASDKSAAAELRARQTNGAFFAALAAALGEDKP